jgi:hypothetical protein
VYPKAVSIAVGLKLIEIDDGGHDVAYDLAGSDHSAQKLPLSIWPRRDQLRHWTPMARDTQRLPRFIDLFDKSKAFGFELGYADALHDHYFIYSQ